jgi:hypothetical protein
MEEEFCIEMNNKIIPKTMKYKNEIYDILFVNPKLIIRKHIIKLKDGKLKRVELVGKHPNCSNTTNEFCLPFGFVGKKFDKATREMIEYLISTYNLDSCYFMPWGMIKYKKREVIDER